jgi:uncharacterized protein YjbJ (UPF0337 family)
MEGAVVTEKWEGKLKEAEGKLTDDELREAQGKTEAAWGETKEKAEDIAGEAKEKAEDIGTEAERRWEGAKEGA